MEQGRDIEATTVEEWREKMRLIENVRDLVRKHNEQVQERQAKAFDQRKNVQGRTGGNTESVLTIKRGEGHERQAIQEVRGTI